VQYTKAQAAEDERDDSPSAKRNFSTRRFARRARRKIFTRADRPTPLEIGFAALSALLLILAFPDFNFYFLAWLALAPLLLAIARQPRATKAFLLGWTCGTIFFYGSCYWLTHSMIHYGGIPPALAFLLLIPGALIVGVFPALFAALFARACQTFGGGRAFLFAPFLWTATEWLRFEITGQLWNAVGYSQAFHPTLIQSARWGGVYAVGFLIAATNAALAALLLSWRAMLIQEDRRARQPFIFALSSLAAIAAVIVLQVPLKSAGSRAAQTPIATKINETRAIIIAVQPDVPVDFYRTDAEREAILQAHFDLSRYGLKRAEQKFTVGDTSPAAIPRIVVFPESPANFSYSYDARFRQQIEDFARANHVSMIFNSLEPAPDGGFYNASVMLDAEGHRAAQYDKIQLVPFGERIPLPKWFPLRAMLGTIVGEFTPGETYTLMPLGAAKVLTNAEGAKVNNADANNASANVDKQTLMTNSDAHVESQTSASNSEANNLRAGVSICVESAYPEIARRFASDGADVFINITNDGYLGRTAVLRQHLANGVFRAVENARPFLSVTNTGISAYVNPRGRTLDETSSYTTDVRVWRIENSDEGKTVYTRYGDWFAVLCVIVSSFAILKRRRI
jgi:apolipoprotein N-acyltransferase